MAYGSIDKPFPVFPLVLAILLWDGVLPLKKTNPQICCAPRRWSSHHSSTRSSHGRGYKWNLGRARWSNNVPSCIQMTIQTWGLLIHQWVFSLHVLLTLWSMRRWRRDERTFFEQVPNFVTSPAPKGNSFIVKDLPARIMIRVEGYLLLQSFPCI